MANTRADEIRDESDLLTRLQDLFEDAKAARRWGSKEPRHQIAWALTEELCNVIETLNGEVERIAKDEAAKRCNDALDEAFDLSREVRTLAETVERETYYRVGGDGARDRVPVDWPEALALAALAWLDADRPAADRGHLRSLATRVASSDWCVVWEGPGPSGCSLARQPDRVTMSADPGELATAVRDLICIDEDLDLGVAA